MCIPVGLMSLAAFNAHEKVQETSAKRAELSANLTHLEKRAQDLEEDIKKLEDPRGIETELRSRYEVGWEGEEVIVLVEEEEKPEQATVTREKEVGFWKGLFE